MAKGVLGHPILFVVIICYVAEMTSSVTLFDIVGLKTLEEFCSILYPKEHCECNRFFLQFKQNNYSLCALLNGTISTAIPPINVTSKAPQKKELKYTLSPQQRAQIALTILASFLGVCGNALVIVVHTKKTDKKNNHKWLITVLAGTDIAFALCSLLNAVPEIFTYRWVYGEGMCRVLHSMYTLGSLNAIGIILIIAVERYVGVLYPFTKGLSAQTGNVLLLINLSICIVSVLPRTIVLEIDALGICVENWPNQNVDSFIYSWFLLVGYAVLPVFVISFLYWRIIVTLHKGFARFNGSIENEMDRNLRMKKLSDNKRIMRILITILVVFVLLTLPSKLYWIVIYSIKLHPETKQLILLFTATAYPFHVAVNPFIYSLIDPKFRRAIVKILACKFFCRSSQATPLAPGQVLSLHNLAFTLQEE